MELGDYYESLESRFNLESAPSFKKLVNFNTNSLEPIHRWFYFKEGFSYALAEKMIAEFHDAEDEKKVVFDPFCGSGTTLVSAQLAGVKSIGTEVNPFLAFIARTKVTNHIRSQSLRKDLGFVLGSKTKLSLEAPSLTTFQRAFETDNLHALLELNHAITKVKDEKNRAVLKLALASIVEESSKVKRYGKGLRFKSSYKKQNPRELFDKKCDLIIEDIEAYGDRTNAIVKRWDAREFYKPDGNVDFVLFSPPYLNTFDYNEIYKLELWLLGFVKTYPAFDRLSKSSLRSHLTIRSNATRFDNPAIMTITKRLHSKRERLWNPHIPEMINAYFIDMNKVFYNLKTVLKRDTTVAFVVGNSSYGRMPIATDVILAKIAEDNGFKVKEIRIARKLSTSSQQARHYTQRDKYYLRESIAILKKK